MKYSIVQAGQGWEDDQIRTVQFLRKLVTLWSSLLAVFHESSVCARCVTPVEFYQVYSKLSLTWPGIFLRFYEQFFFRKFSQRCQNFFQNIPWISKNFPNPLHFLQNLFENFVKFSPNYALLLQGYRFRKFTWEFFSYFLNNLQFFPSHFYSSPPPLRHIIFPPYPN